MATSSEVPGRLPVAIDGHAYQIDPGEFQRASLPVLRQQSDQTTELGEQSLNPRGLWRRSQDSWHHGAGQEFFDAKVGGTVADSERFERSVGADVWTRGQVSNLPKFERIHASGTQVLAVGNHAYIIDGNEVRWAVNPVSGTSWTSADIQAGQAAQAPQSMATDGNYVWVALGSSGLHRTTKGATSSTADVPSQACTLVAFVLGRLLIANNHQLWEVTSPISAPALNLIYTHPDTAFRFAGMGPGRNCIYAWGNIPSGNINLNLGLDMGGQAAIFRIVMNPTDTSLNPPILASYLPDGESIHGLQFYAGGVILGTSRGVRVGAVDGPGNIDYGPLIETPYPVTALEPQSRYCWFGMPQQRHPDGTTSTRRGLGRLDLGYFVDTLTPAYAQDVGLTVSDIGTVTTIAHVAGTQPTSVGNLYFAVNSGGFSVDPRGVYGIDLDGSSNPLYDVMDITTGFITYSTADTKTLRSIEVRHTPMGTDGTVEVFYRTNQTAAWTSLGTNTTNAATSTSFDLATTDVETVEFRFKYTPGAAETSPFSFQRWTLKALPTPVRNETFLLPILMYSKVDTHAGDGQPHSQDVDTEVAFLKGLERSGDVVEFQVGHETLTGYIEESQFAGEKFSFGHDRHPEGVLTLRMTTLDG